MEKKINKRKRVFFYSSVQDMNLFKITGFYSNDINILDDLGYNVYLINSFKNFFKFWKYDIAYIYFWTKGLIPAIISKLFQKKIIFTGGIDNLDRKNNKIKLNYFISKVFFAMCAISSDANIIVSKSDINNIKNTYPRAKRIYYLPHIIDFEKYEYDGCPKKDIITTVVWMGNRGNVERKGVDKLLHVYNEYLKYDQNVDIVIIGSIGEGTIFLKDIVKKYKMEKMVTFTGQISEYEKIKYLKESKYYFQLSEYEGFGIAAIEALAAGNIVIHSGRGGLAETMNSFGIRIKDIYDYKDIAVQLSTINKNYANYSELIKGGVKHVKDNFSYDVRKNGIARIINEIYGDS